MSRKETPRQNDISIIIGSLPRRLQRKIAEDVGVNITENCINNNNGHVSRTVRKHKAEGGGDGSGVPHIDYFLRLGTKYNSPPDDAVIDGASVLDSDASPTESQQRAKMTRELVRSAAIHALKSHQGDDSSTSELDSLVAATSPPKSELKNEMPQDNAVGPGILHLSAEATKLKKVGPNGVIHENGRKLVRAPRTEVLSKMEPPASPMRNGLKFGTYPTWFASLDELITVEVVQLHDQYVSFLQQNLVLEKWRHFCDLRKKLQQIFIHLLLHHLKLVCEQKVDTYFWKLLFYNVKEYLQKQRSRQTSNYILLLIDAGQKFYADALYQLRTKFLSGEGTLRTVGGGELQRLAQNKYEFIAKVTAQKLLISLGDLSRYKMKQLQGDDFTEALDYYQQAQTLIPTNGIPYNQLAIVAIIENKKFDAIYFHMRSLLSSNAIYSAKESLLMLFEEIRLKYEETDLKASPVHRYPTSNDSKSMRKEVWIYPDGSRHLHRNELQGNKLTITEEKRYDEMPAEQLLRRLYSSFLYMIGKLYTGVGMEAIQEHQRKLVIQLIAVLKREPLLIARERMLQMVALNIFVLEHNKLKDTRRYHAFNFCNQIFGLLLQKCNETLTTYEEDIEELAGEDLADLNTLLQFVRIYTDWLSQNINIWEPLKNKEDSFVDCWSEFEKLFPHFQRILAQRMNSHGGAEFKHAALAEDDYLVGFIPLAAVVPPNKCNAANLSDETAQFYARIARIAEFQTCYAENQHRLQVPQQPNFIVEDLNSVIKTALNSLQMDDEIGAENNGINGKKPAPDVEQLPDVVNGEVLQLSKYKRELEAKTNMKKKCTAKLEQILKFIDTKLYIEVRPKYLLPDTNCFIDSLEDLERLLTEFNGYVLTIPLTVVKELDGLSKGVKLEALETLPKHRIHHFDEVSSRAKKSLDFIKSAKNQVKCATTKGSFINASLFGLVEELCISNDDKILATALALSKTMSTETYQDGKCIIQTELVLITTDRNLRVKALARNLAVSEMDEFLQWAKDCNT